MGDHRAVEPTPSPDEVLAAARAQDDAVHSLRVRFRSTAYVAGEAHETTGVAVAQRPERLRLRLFLPFGLTAYDLLVRDGSLTETIPSGPQPARDERRDAALAAPPTDFSADDLAVAFLRGARAYPGHCTARPGAVAGTVDVECRSDDAPARAARRLRLDAATASVREEATLHGDREGTVIRSDDLRRVDGVWLPFHVEIVAPGEGPRITIEVERWEVNPRLDDSLFEPLAGGPPT